MRKMTRKYQYIAIAFLSLMIWDIVCPTVSYALTGGPSQPEFEAFEPVSTDQMVDLFSGDFTYNIPLMTVPGPNGGYPINLAYHSGIGMEQEASWVGLGWNINVGEITRQMRGLPDDFNGDEVSREFHMKPTVNVSVDMHMLGDEKTFEIKGVNIKAPPARLSLSYNNYSGVGASYNRSFIPGIPKGGFSEDAFVTYGLSADLGLDSQRGLEFSPSIGLSSQGEKEWFKAAIGPKFSSRYGLETMDLRAQGDFKVHQTARNLRGEKFRTGRNLDQAGGAAVSSATPTYVPGSFAPFKGSNVNLGFALGPFDGVEWTKDQGFSGTYSEQKLDPDFDTDYPAFGYLHTQDAPDNGRRLMDYNRDKDVPVSKRIPVAPMPVYTHDMFFIKGQGVGGAFRPHRSDVGILSQESHTSKTRSGALNLELSSNVTPGNFHTGISPSFGLTRTYQGNWQHGTGAMTGSTDLSAQLKTTDDPLFESAYFRMNGEQTAMPTDEYSDINEDQPVRYKLGLQSGAGFALAPSMINDIGPSNVANDIPSSASKQGQRTIRNTNIEYRTVEQLTSDGCCSTTGKSVQNIFYEEGELPSSANALPVQYTYRAISPSHIAEMSVLNPAGDRYVYGLPAYVTDHIDVSYAKDNAVYLPDPTPRVVDMNISSSRRTEISSVKNEQGQNQWCSRISLPPYVHSHLLTEVRSAEYVDITGDGPSDDDLGYYVKFNYHKPIDYQWRTPYDGSYFDTGYLSNENDDKASYSYGSRDQHYLHSVETKTHVALFILADRDDAQGVDGEWNENSNKAESRKLQSIELYSKNDLTKALKTVVLEQNYELCGGVPNNAVQGEGKLTLNSVTIKHLDSEKGSLNPYRFGYYDADTSTPNVLEPSYDQAKMDRWGNYTDPLNGYNLVQNPFVDQSSTGSQDVHASSWLMNKIELPSGGEILIDYESDDYAYVQDHLAGQMCKITNTGNSATAFDNDIKKNDLVIHFELDRQMVPSDQDDIREFNNYVRDLDEVYFKTWQDLKAYPGETARAYDYVSGYAEINKTGPSGIDPSGFTGHITLKGERYGPANAFGVHPFRKAGWQYLRYERSDLIDASGVGGSIAQIIPNLLNAVPRLLNWYAHADVWGYCKELDLGPSSQPSFLRLSTPDGSKYGGGSRVAKVRLKDNWIEGSQEFGKQYTYRTKNDLGEDISSGVAAYEPMIGGEEISLRKPKWYNGNDANISFSNRMAFIEEPLGEAYYPGASVGYSRVVVTDLQDMYLEYEETMPGTGVHEFYTAKEFPVEVRHTELESKRFTPPNIFIPFVGLASFNNHGYSMGYTVHLNDMHGKPKSVASYRYKMEDVQEPVTRTTYKYHEDAGQPSRLDNTVDVLYDQFNVQEAVVGRTMDFFVEAREQSTRGDTYGLNFNVEQPILPVWLMIEPQLVRSEAMFRSVVTNKVVQCNGLLKEVINEVDGAKSVSTNLLYDAYSGQPLLTSVNNSWEDPVYTYNYAAHMAYDGMGNASKNWGAECALTASGGTYTLNPSSLNAADIFHLSDEVVDDGGVHFWVNSISGNQIGLEDKNGNSTSITGDIKIIRSGYRNQQSVVNGTIVSLNDIWSGAFLLFSAFNDQISGSGQYTINDYEFSCSNLVEDISVASVQPGTSPVTYGGIDFDFPGATGEDAKCGLLNFTTTMPSLDPSDYLILGFNGVSNPVAGQNFIWQYGVDVQYVGSGPDNGTIYPAIWKDFELCFEDCIKVLHADATEFQDSWQYDYSDVNTTGLSGSDHHDGRKGIWRPLRNHLYQVDRLNFDGQSTNARYDGEYEQFQFFNFDPGANNGDDWVAREQMNLYSPYGFALESENSIGIKSAELYGYNNSLVTAVAANCGYYELCYDGFEDHVGGVYAAGHGHIALTGSSTPTLTSTESHTGGRSMIKQVGQTINISGIPYAPTPSVFLNWTPGSDKKYVVSAWFKTTDRSEQPEIYVSNGATVVLDNVVDDQVPIEGWRKVDVEFTVPSGSGTLDIEFKINGQTSTAYIDDIRIHPAEGSCVTHCYDPDLYWLRATLDDRNYATLYNYDEEGTLIQVKQETENGIVTLKSTRQNTAHP